MSNKTLPPAFSSTPSKAIPLIGTQARQYLDLLTLGEVKETDAMLLFNGNQRSPIQALGGDDYCHWLIHPIKNDKEIIVSRILDERHFSGDKKLDADARKERRHELKKRSHKQAKEGVARESKARQELSEATSEYLLSLGEAVNDA